MDQDTLYLLLGLAGLMALQFGGFAFLLNRREAVKDVRIANLALNSEPSNAQNQSILRRHHQLCKAVTFFRMDAQGIHGKVLRDKEGNPVKDVFHTNPSCPQYNSKGQTRDQLLIQFRGTKYSTNTHRMGD